MNLMKSPLKAATAIVPRAAQVTANGSLVTRVAQTLSCEGVTVTVAQVADARPITVGSPPATCALTLA